MTHGQGRYLKTLTLLVLFYGRAVSFLLRMAIPPLIPFFIEQFKWDSVQIGLLASAYLWSYASTQILWGLVVDKWGGKIGLLAGWMTMTTASLVFAFGSSLEQLTFLRLLFGFGAASVLVASVVIISEVYETGERGRPIGVIGASSSIGTLCAGVAIPYLLSTNIRLYHLEVWRSVCILITIPAFLATFAPAIISDRRRSKPFPYSRPRDGSHSSLSKRVVFGDPRLYLMSAAMAGYLIGFTAISTWIYVYLYQEYGLPGTVAGILASSAIFLPGIPSSVVSGWLSDHVKTRKMVPILGAVASAAIMAVLVFKLPLPLTALSLILYGVFSFFHTPILSLPAETWPLEVSGTALSVITELSQFGAAVTPVLSGYLLAQTGSYDSIWILGSAAYIAAVTALIAIKNPNQEDFYQSSAR